MEIQDLSKTLEVDDGMLGEHSVLNPDSITAVRWEDDGEAYSYFYIYLSADWRVRAAAPLGSGADEVLRAIALRWRAATQG